MQKMDGDQLREMGEKFLAAGDATNAMRYLTMADQKQPKDPLILYDLGDAYDSRGMSEKALEYFLLAVQFKPDYPEAYNALGKIYAEQGKIDEAMQAFQKALSSPFYQTPFIPLFNIGLLYERQQNWPMALSHYQHAVQANRNYGAAYHRMGKALETLGRKEEAREAYANAVQNAPNMAAAHYDFARLCYQAGDFVNAAFSFNRVLKLAPNTPMAVEAERGLQALDGQKPR